MAEPELIEFQSEGERVEAFWYPAQGVDGPAPAVVLAGGWCYVKELVQPKYAAAFAEAGISALLFDYRRLGGSARRAPPAPRPARPDRGLQERAR